MKKILMLGLCAIGFASCKKNNSRPLLQRLYIESAPMKGVSQMNFLNNSLVVYSIPEAPMPYIFFER